jgi:hypothetical protein
VPFRRPSSSACSTRWWKNARFGSPVSASWSAWYSTGHAAQHREERDEEQEQHELEDADDGQQGVPSRARGRAVVAGDGQDALRSRPLGAEPDAGVGLQRLGRAPLTWVEWLDGTGDAAGKGVGKPAGLVRQLPDAGPARGVGDETTRPVELDAQAVVNEHALGEEAVEVAPSLLRDRVHEVGAAEPVGRDRRCHEVRVEASSRLGAPTLVMADEEQDGAGGDRQADAGVQGEAEDEPRRRRVAAVPSRAPPAGGLHGPREHVPTGQGLPPCPLPWPLALPMPSPLPFPC